LWWLDPPDLAHVEVNEETPALKQVPISSDLRLFQLLARNSEELTEGHQ
jgi:hypothetical protein